MTDHFPRETAGLPVSRLSEVVDVADGGRVELRVAPVTKQVGAATVRMLAYNGSIPGPTLRVRQDSEIDVDVVNEGDMDATVHWHGLRLGNRFDGTHETQAPIPIGGHFTSRVAFPDPGVYRYHPHIREDYGQEMGPVRKRHRASPRSRLLHPLTQARRHRHAHQPRRFEIRDTLIASSPRAARRHGIHLHGRTERIEGRQVRIADGAGLTPCAVIWATGFVLNHSFVKPPAFDDTGSVMHQRGVTASPGLYFLGLPWQHTRGSALLGWVQEDAVIHRRPHRGARRPSPDA